MSEDFIISLPCRYFFQTQVTFNRINSFINNPLHNTDNLLFLRRSSLRLPCPTMSTRWYPIYQRGNPQLRVFLPNFWMKLVHPTRSQLPNIVNFQCSMEMTKHDIRNYLEKIYNVPVVDVRTRIGLGKFKRDIGKGYITKDDDVKFAFVTLPKDQKFEYPDLFAAKTEDEEEKQKSLDDAKNTFKTYIEHNKNRSDVPSWFSI